MSWFRRRPVAPSVRVESEEARIARRVREMRDAEGEPQDPDPSDAFPGGRTDAAPEPAPAPCLPSHAGGSPSTERGGLDLNDVAALMDEVRRLRTALREIQNETDERAVFARCVAALERPRWWHEATGV